MPRLSILPQPDDVTCGPTCLHALYKLYGDDLPIDQVIREVSQLPTQGTLAVLLAQHALERGYRATIFTYNLHVFDPTWFRTPGVDLREKLRAQAAEKANEKLRYATEAYLRYLDIGGRLRYQPLTRRLLRTVLGEGYPILTGLSATYLYGCSREIEEGPGKMRYDDVAGTAQGHFVLLYGYHPRTREVLVADPLRENPRFGDQHYSVGIQRVMGAIFLGVMTYDANLLVLKPPTEPREGEKR